jgi:ubiquinone/menaquinone biosynthesis C-methylase UbiE
MTSFSVEQNAARDVGSNLTAIATRNTEQAFWRRYFKFYDTLNQAIPYQRMVERHVALIATKPRDFVLDAGTGTGNIALALTGAGAQVIGVDFLESALEVCRRKMPQGDFRFADLSKQLEFPDHHFDKITCCNVLYILSPEAQANAVSELFRVLKPGGIASITVFGENFNSLKVYVDALREHRKTASLVNTFLFGCRYSINSARILYYVRKIRRRQTTGDYTFFTPEHVTRLLTGGGFQVELVEPTLSGQCLIALARKPA